MAGSRKQARGGADPCVFEQAGMEARLRLAAIVQSSYDAIIGKDINGIITDWNNGAERLYGYSADEIIGKPISILMPPNRADDSVDIMRRTRAGETIKHLETIRQRKDGTQIEVSLTISPIRDPEGRLVGASVISRDASERQHQESALRESEERFRLAAQAGRMFAYEWDPTTEKFVVSGIVNEILGDDVGVHATLRHILTMIPAEDRERVLAAADQLTPEKPSLQIRHRMVRSDGTVIWVERSSRAYFDEHGKMLRAVGMLVDITDHVRAQQALRQKDRELSEAQRLAGVGNWHWDARNDLVTWSEELYRIAGLDPTLPAPNYKEHPSLYTTESWERLRHAVDRTLREGTCYELDLELVRPDGTTRWITARGEAMGDITGRIIGLRGTVHDITERKRSGEALARMSRKLLEAQEQERARIARELHDDISQQLALLSVQIQRMKEAFPASAEARRSQMTELEQQISEIATAVQSLSHELHSSRLEYLGVASAIRGFCKEFGEKHKVKVAFDNEGIPPTVPQEVSLCLFRVVQEALHNAVKHSGVQFFEVKLHGSPTEIHLTVRDSGVGFDSELARDTQGLGLVSMQERVRLINGTILITSKPGSGTEINVCVPLSAGMPREQTQAAGA